MHDSLEGSISGEETANGGGIFGGYRASKSCRISWRSMGTESDANDFGMHVAGVTK
jgi:hypothetical protein